MRYLLPLIIAACAAVWWAWPPSPVSTPERANAETNVAAEGVTANPDPAMEIREPIADQAADNDMSEEVVRAVPAHVPPPTASSEPISTDSLSGLTWRLRREASEWRADDYLQLAREQALDREVLYLAFEFLKSCFGRPLSVAQFEAQAARYERQHSDHPERFNSETLDNTLEFLQEGLDRCGGLDEVQLSVAAYEALELSADMGFVPARLEYLRSAGRTLLQQDGWVFANPDYVTRYRDRAEAYSAEILRLNLPEGYLAYAEFLVAGMLQPPDPVQAFAFALLARDIDRTGAAGAEGMLRRIGSQLTEAEIEEATALRRLLCERYCQKS